MKKEWTNRIDISTYAGVRDHYLNNLSYKDKFKNKLIQSTITNPKEHADLFAYSILSSDKPFELIGGATYSEIGQHVEGELFMAVCVHLLEKLTSSIDPWVDIQQIGRWVQQDFMDYNVDMNHDEKITSMVNKMMDYFESRIELS